MATPIGNLGDFSPRASEIIAQARVMAAEDTRVSGRLVKMAGASSRMVSLTEHNVMQRAPGLVVEALAGVVVLVSDAGTPGVADPGARLVEAMHAAGITVVAVPGPSALAAAVSVSGFDGSDVYFIGFPPRQRAARISRFMKAATVARTIVYFESPGRLSPSLRDLSEALGNPETVVCRELTKIHEEVVRGRASALAERFEGTLGECAVVVRSPELAQPTADEADLVDYMAEMRRAGAQRARAAGEASSRFGVARKDAYAAWPPA